MSPSPIVRHIFPHSTKGKRRLEKRGENIIMKKIIVFLSLLLISAVQSQTLLLSTSRPYSSGGRRYCDSWRLSVEANNAGPWKVQPKKCVRYVQRYIEGDMYGSDCEVAADDAIEYARTVKIAGDGKDVWVFDIDIDETLLSNLDYYRQHGYGSEPFDSTAFDEYVFSLKAPALQANLRLYKELHKLGFKTVLLTGRDENQRNVTETNLLLAGYSSWDRLLLRAPSDKGKAAVLYKSGKRAELVAQGFRIHGSSGDQWSDLLGSPMATRSFKVPNPLYYIS